MATDNSNRGKNAVSAMQQLAMAIELPFVMIAAVLVGGGGGYLLDHKLHTSPAFMLIGGVLGLAAGMREIIRKLSPSGKQGSKRGGG